MTGNFSAVWLLLYYSWLAVHFTETNLRRVGEELFTGEIAIGLGPALQQ